jgi:hypothetical protein
VRIRNGWKLHTASRTILKSAITKLSSHSSETEHTMTQLVHIHFEADYCPKAVVKGLNQIAERGKKKKKARIGVKCRDRTLVKKLLGKEECERVELARVHCYSYPASRTTLMAIQVIYRSYLIDGTIRESIGSKHYFQQGLLYFKRSKGNVCKLSFENTGRVITAWNEDNSHLVVVSQSLRVGMLRY